jgi:hypothetical protein
MSSPICSSLACRLEVTTSVLEEIIGLSFEALSKTRNSLRTRLAMTSESAGVCAGDNEKGFHWICATRNGHPKAAKGSFGRGATGGWLLQKSSVPPGRRSEVTSIRFIRHRQTPVGSDRFHLLTEERLFLAWGRERSWRLKPFCVPYTEAGKEQSALPAMIAVINVRLKCDF